MKPLVKYVLLFPLLFAVADSFAQQNKIDSLLTLLKTDSPDTIKLKHLNQLSWYYNNVGSNENAMVYANSGLLLSGDILKKATDPFIRQTAQKGEATSYMNIGNAYSDISNFSEAIKNYSISLKIFESIGDKKGTADSYMDIGSINLSQGNYPEAIKNYFASLKIREAMNDKDGIARTYNNIGNVYFAQCNYSEALKNYFASLNISNLIDDKTVTARSYNGIGNVYNSQCNYPEALKYYSTVLKIGEETGNQFFIAGSYNNLGVVYQSQSNYQEALNMYFETLKIGEATDNQVFIATSYNNIGEIFRIQKKYKRAEDYLIKAKELSKEIGLKENLREVYMQLSELDSAIGNFAGAYENHKLYILYRDSLDNEETRKRTIQSQMTFDFEKQEAVANVEHKKELENQQALSEVKSRKQKTVLLFVVSGLVLVFVFAGFIFRALRTTRKQKNIIELQKQLVEEKQKEILDSIHYARRIQSSLLPSEKYIDRSLNRLKEV